MSFCLRLAIFELLLLILLFYSNFTQTFFKFLPLLQQVIHPLSLYLLQYPIWLLIIYIQSVRVVEDDVKHLTIS